MQLRKENIDQKLAMVQGKKDELINEKAVKTKEVMFSVDVLLIMLSQPYCRSWMLSLRLARKTKIS